MTEELYTQLKPHKPHLQAWCTKQDSVNSTVLRSINAIYRLIFPSAKPVNMSCYACINDMMHVMNNVLNQYESTINK